MYYGSICMKMSRKATLQKQPAAWLGDVSGLISYAGSLSTVLLKHKRRKVLLKRRLVCVVHVSLCTWNTRSRLSGVLGENSNSVFI